MEKSNQNINSINYPNLSSWQDKIWFFLKIYLKNKKLIGFYIALIFFTSVLDGLIPLFAKLQIDQLQHQSNQVFNVSIDPFFYLIFLITIPVTLEFIRQHYFGRFQESLMFKIQHYFRITSDNLIWKKMKEFDAGFFESKRNNFLISEGQGSGYVIDEFFRFIIDQFRSIITFATIFPLLLLVDWRLFLLLTLTSLAQWIINQKMEVLSRKYSLFEHQHSQKFWRIKDALRNNYFDLKTHGDIDKFVDISIRMKQEELEMDLTRRMDNLFYSNANWLAGKIFLIIANMFVGYQVFQGNMSIGTFTLAISYSAQILSYFDTLIGGWRKWKNIDFDLLKLDFFFKLNSRLEKNDHPIPIPRKPKCLELKRVNFIYPNFYNEEQQYLRTISERLKGSIQKGSSDWIEEQVKSIEQLISEKPSSKKVLSDVSLKLEVGKIVALVGRNGSGKTTITHLLQRHYDPTNGSVLLNGQPLSMNDLEQLTRQFSWLKQSPFMINGLTIRENLLMGVDEKAKVSDTKLWDLLKSFKLDDVINSLPKKLDSRLGEDTSLSGGQTQLLAIIRCLIQNRPFIFFDEGSSQLDVEKEFLVLKHLKDKKKNAGILFITHRMSVARKADYIYVIEQGKIVEHGTHAELLGNKGLYAQFWAMQVIE